MKIIGITGGIGSGKSTVLQFLAELGATILDADKVGHKAFQPESELWCQLVTTFGKQIVANNGSIDREKLGKIVFHDTKARTQLNQIMHPAIYAIVKVQFEEYRKQGIKVVVLEAPLLLEAGWDSLVDEIWVTVASERTILKRLQERSGLSEQESQARIQSQLNTEERIRHADVVIDTDCDLAELKAKVKNLWQKSQEPNKN